MFQSSDMITRQIRFECPDCGRRFERSVTLPADFQIFRDGDKLVCNPCGTQRREREERKHSEQELAKRLAETNIKPEFLRYDVNKGNSAMLQWVNANSDKNLLLISEVNSGKTRAMCKALHDAFKCGLRVRYIEFANLSALYSGEKKESTTAAERLINRICGAWQILVIDDVDKVRLTETTGELLYKILNAVYSGASKTKIWLTSNHSGDELLRKFENADQGAAVLSRIERMIDDGRFAVRKF